MKLLAAIPLFLAFAHQAFASESGLSDQDVYQVALHAISSTRLRGATVSPLSVQSKYFFEFQAISPNPSTSLLVANVAINRRTVDVWDTAGSCSRIESPELSKVQREVRQRFKLSLAEYTRLHAMKPSCDSSA
jgi:hypothetical protein